MNSSKIRLPPNVSIEKVIPGDNASSPTDASKLKSPSPKSSQSENVLGDSSKYSQVRDIRSKEKVIPDINISYDELKVIGTRQLNILLKNVSKDRSLEIKNIRRTLKNRNYASCSRERSLEEKEKIEKEIKSMNEKMKKINDQIKLCRQAIDGLIDECDQLLHSLDQYEDSEELKAEVKDAVLKECSISDKELEKKFLSLGL